MRDIFSSMDTLRGSDFYQNLPNRLPEQTDRVLQSLRIEDLLYSDARLPVDDVLSEIEMAGKEKLPSIGALTRDVFQSLYAFQHRYTPEDQLSAYARKMNRRILSDITQSPDYLALKSICEGRILPAIEGTLEFMQQTLERLDELVDSANGEKDALGTLARQEQSQAQRLEAFQEENRRQQGQPSPNPIQEKKLLQTGNRLHSKVRQLLVLEQMVDDTLQINKETVQSAVFAAVKAALDKADEAQCAVLSWGDDPASMEASPENRELLQRVRQNDMLCKIARYLGRLKEMLQQKRKNSYAFGRGEKYSLEMGNDLKSVITSEFAMLASPETILLFLRKHARKSLKQYKRRERVYKGSGDIICCLDESTSTRGDNAAWGKAVALALQDVAATHRRSFALVHFASSRSYRTDVFLPSKYTPADLMDTASLFLGGGTNFETPMREAMRLMERDGFQKADIVFITDGECEMEEAFVVQLKQKQTDLSFTITGVLMDQDSPGMAFSLKPFCNEVYRISELGGDQIADMLLSQRVE